MGCNILLHCGSNPRPLSEAELREVIEDSFLSRNGRTFYYDPELLNKLSRHGVFIQDLLHILHTWQRMEPVWDEKYSGWRYILQGLNLNAKWMKAVIAHNRFPAEEIVAITGFKYSRGGKS